MLYNTNIDTINIKTFSSIKRLNKKPQESIRLDA